jgi:hypothetical protein
MPLWATEIWQVGIWRAPVSTIARGGVSALPAPIWLPAPGDFRFLADPFGIWRDGTLWVFVEAFDYRTKHGEIRYFAFDSQLRPAAAGLALRTAHHLSYPQVFEHAGAMYMLPEAHRSGRLTLYRARQFPDQWEPAAVILDAPAIDATIVRVEELWWMFFTLPGPDRRAMRELHAAYASAPTGPWRLHPRNPVRRDLASARPGGSPFMHDGRLVMPTQNCTTAYGEAVTLLRVDALTPETFVSDVIGRIGPTEAGVDARGLHTLSGCGPITLFDVKHIDRSPRRGLINLTRRLRRWTGQIA